jgi:PIN domain nuclease of toxin-antitoxin system
VLWWRTDSPRLGRRIRRAIGTADVVWVSAVSGWEVAIKRVLGKLQIQDSFASMVKASRFDELAVTLRHAEQLGLLIPHHTDLFDRMLIAQAQVEKATLVTHDRRFEPYDVPILWV